MAQTRVGGELFFDRGIESITVKTNKEPSPHLPVDLPDWAPLSQGQRPQLEQVLFQPNLADYIEQAVLPTVLDRELLKPTKFRKTLNSARQALEDRASATEAEGSESVAAKILGRARRLLREESECYELLQAYRRALVQG